MKYFNFCIFLVILFCNNLPLNVKSDVREYCYNIISKIFNKPEICDTRDPLMAGQIYKNHGVVKNLSQHVCSTINDKTNQKYGDAVCKRAISKLYRDKSIIGRSRCDKAVPMAGLKKDSLDYIMMAKCVYEPDNRKYFYVINTPVQNFYYVVDYNLSEKTGTVIACLYLKIDMFSDFHTVKPIPTTDAWEADDIFGVYGSIGIKPMHEHLQKFQFCEESVGGSILFVRDNSICDKALDKIGIGKFGQEVKLLKQFIKCEKGYIIRDIVDFESLYLQMDGPYSYLTCPYLLNNEEHSLNILNGPTEGLFYVLSETSRGYVKIISCFSLL